MQGHQEIIQMRIERKKPTFVFLNDYPAKQIELGDFGSVCISPTEAIETLDLRFLKGLKVSASSHTEKRAKALLKACIDAGATTVAACHVKPSLKLNECLGWSEVWHG